MANSVAIITYISESDSSKYLLRTLRNIDEQSYNDWHHFLVLETEKVQQMVQSSLSLLSDGYATKHTFLAFDQAKVLLETVESFDFAAFHPVMDLWSPYFLEKVLKHIEECPIDICGAWCSYNTAIEAVRGNIISIDKLEPGPYFEGLLVPSYDVAEQFEFIQGIFYTEDIVPIFSHVHPKASPLIFAALLLGVKDVLGLQNRLATVHKRDEENHLQQQQIRNWIYRQYPALLTASIYERSSNTDQ